MKKIKIVALPKEVLKKAKIIGNVFDIAEKREEFLNDWFQRLTCELFTQSAGLISDGDWNKKIAPLLRKKGKELGLKWLQNY